MEFENFSPSSERNQAVILSVLVEVFEGVSNVLEVGSGSGQHAVYFCEGLSCAGTNIESWQASELAANVPPLRRNLARFGDSACVSPVELDVLHPEQSTLYGSDQQFDGFYTANTLHIMSWEHVEALFSLLPQVLKPNADVCIYGPFKYQGRFTSESNARFEQWLKARDVRSGIREFEAVNALAKSVGLSLIEDISMPANNQCLHWRFTG